MEKLKLFTLALALVCFPLISEAITESWVSRYALKGDTYSVPIAVKADRAGNVIVAGWAWSSAGRYDIYTARYAAADGHLLWENRYDGPQAGTSASPRALAIDSAGNPVVVGERTDSSARSEIYVAKYAANDGRLLWEKAYNGKYIGEDEGTAVVIDSEDNIFVAGQVLSPSSTMVTKVERYVAKYAGADGRVLWTRLDDTDSDGALSSNEIVLDAAGNVLVTGSSIRGTEMNTAKYSGATGTVLWRHRYTGPANKGARGANIAVDPAGNAVVTGTATNANGQMDYCTVKLSASAGLLRWVRVYNGPANGQDFGEAVAVTSAGDVVVTGSSSDASGAYDSYTVKYAGGDGRILWEQRVSGPEGSSEVAHGLSLDANGNAVTLGCRIVDKPGGETSQMLTTTYAGDDGRVLWQKFYQGPKDGINAVEEPRQLALDAEGNAIAACRSAGLTGEEMAIVKYVESAAPKITSTTVEMVSPTRAVVHATVNPNGAETAVSIQYGATSEYGSKTGSISIGAGEAPLAKDFEIEVLPHATYHFRAVASNARGETQGTPVVFTVPNQQPTLKNDEVMLQAGAFVVSVTGNDVDTDGDHLTVTSANGGAFGTVSVADGVVTYTAGPDFSVYDTFNYTVTDGFGGTATATATIFASSMDRWRVEKFGSEARNEAVAGDEADPDLDGAGNLLEYAAGSLPTVVDGSSPEISVVDNRVRLRFFRSQRSDDLEYAVQASSDLRNWVDLATSRDGQPVSALTSGIIVKETPQGDRILVELEDTQTVSSSESRFLRVRISR